MRFIHTADWQIGMRAVHAGKAAEKVRAARLETGKRVLELAAREAVDFILLAGDTFEDNALDRSLLIETARLLESAACPVFVLPGNHDPLRPGSVWEYPIWKQIAKVTVLGTCAPVAVPGGYLLPCPLLARRSHEDPTAWINDQRLDGIRVVVAHGNAGELMAEEGGSPISFGTPERTHADYVALGHWHSTVQFRSNGAVRMAYSGTHETTRFGEPDSGNVLLVSIPAPGSAPEVSVKKVGRLRWYQVGTGETITAPGKLAETARTLAQIADPQNSLVEVALTGLLFECDRDEIARIQALATRFLHARIDRLELRPAPNDERWIENLPAGAIRMGAGRLQQLAGAGGDTGEIATEALLNLYTFAQEVRQ